MLLLLLLLLPCEVVESRKAYDSFFVRHVIFVILFWIWARKTKKNSRTYCKSARLATPTLNTDTSSAVSAQKKKLKYNTPNMLLMQHAAVSYLSGLPKRQVHHYNTGMVVRIIFIQRQTVLKFDYLCSLQWYFRNNSIEC
jgi:hypothetical protein